MYRISGLLCGHLGDSHYNFLFCIIKRDGNIVEKIFKFEGNHICSSLERLAREFEKKRFC